MKRATLIIIFILFGASPLLACDTFEDVSAQVRAYKEPTPFFITFSGCIERVQEKFDGKLMEEIVMRFQTVKAFKKDSVRNMSKLKRLVLERCEVTSIDPEAFRNVIRIEEVVFNYNDIKHIHKGTFTRNMPLKIINLSHNNISTVEDFADIPTLRTLNLSNNQIESFDRDWFKNSTRLESFDISNNKIIQIPTRAFALAKNVQSINFENNQIATIAFKAFDELTSMQVLNLRRNKLKQIYPEIFSAFIHVGTLKLNGNLINFLSDGFLKRLTVEEIYLEGNPILCNCLDAVRGWLERTSGKLVTDRECSNEIMPICVFPSKLGSGCVEECDEAATSRFFKTISKIKKEIDEYCVQNEYSR